MPSCNAFTSTDCCVDPHCDTHQAQSREGFAFLCPRKSYDFSVPTGMQYWDSFGSDQSELGYRISPYITLWYINFASLCAKREITQGHDLLQTSYLKDGS